MSARRGRLAVAAAAVVLQAAVLWRPALAQPPTPPAAITVTVTCDRVGLTAFSVEVAGVNFNPFTAVLVTFDADVGGQPESFDATTDGFGRFDVTFHITDRPPGTYLVRADDFREREATATVVDPCAAFTPVMRFHPAVTRGGFVVELDGTGFPRNATVALAWGILLEPPRFTPTTVTTDGRGGFKLLHVLVFHGTRAGKVNVVATPGDTSVFPATPAPLLVVPGSLQPPDLKERR